MSVEKAKDLPIFKYNPNAYENDSFWHLGGETVVCQCCGNETEYYVDSLYSEDEVSYICPFCIANGAAAKMFDGQFNSYAPDIGDSAKEDELIHRTPRYVTCQVARWFSCCDDYCAFVGHVYEKELNELENSGVLDELIASCLPSGVEKVELLNRIKSCQEWAYLHRCLHCGKYFMFTDLD